MPLLRTRPPAATVNDPIVTYTVLARQLMDQHGLHDWAFDTDNAKRRAGCCRHRRRLITLSRHYVTLNTDKPDDIRDTILHEIAHAIAGHKAGHGPDWRAVCTQVGARPERCYDSAVITMPKPRLQATCGCGKVFTRHKQPRKGSWRYCVPCGPEKGRLKFITKETV